MQEAIASRHGMAIMNCGGKAPKTQNKFDKKIVALMQDRQPVPSVADKEHLNYVEDLFKLSLGIGKSDRGRHVMHGYYPPSYIQGVEDVRTFQQNNGLTADGILGPRTQKKYDELQAVQQQYATQPYAMPQQYTAPQFDTQQYAPQYAMPQQAQEVDWEAVVRTFNATAQKVMAERAANPAQYAMPQEGVTAQISGAYVPAGAAKGAIPLGGQDAAPLLEQIRQQIMASGLR